MIKEKLFEDHPSEENRSIMQRAQAEYKKYFIMKKFFGNRRQVMSGSRVGTEILDSFIA